VQSQTSSVPQSAQNIKIPLQPTVKIEKDVQETKVSRGDIHDQHLPRKRDSLQPPRKSPEPSPEDRKSYSDRRSTSYRPKSPEPFDEDEDEDSYDQDIAYTSSSEEYPISDTEDRRMKSPEPDEETEEELSIETELSRSGDHEKYGEEVCTARRLK